MHIISAASAFEQGISSSVLRAIARWHGSHAAWLSRPPRYRKSRAELEDIKRDRQRHEAHHQAFLKVARDVWRLETAA